MTNDTGAISASEIELLVFGEECACESLHTYTPYCSGQAAYRVSGCTRPRLVCASSVDDPVTGTRVRRETHRCNQCQRDASECWTITPI